LLLSYLKLKFGFFSLFCAGSLGDLAVSVIKYVNLNSNILSKNNVSSTALLSAKTKANIGLVLTRRITIKQFFLIYKHTRIVIAKEKAYIKKSYFC